MTAPTHAAVRLGATGGIAAHAGSCAAGSALVFFGVSPMRQLPSPSAAAWLFDLGLAGGPWIVVLRDREDEARERLAEHLVELGQADTVKAGMEALTRARVDHAGVVW